MHLQLGVKKVLTFFCMPLMAVVEWKHLMGLKNLVTLTKKRRTQGTRKGVYVKHDRTYNCSKCLAVDKIESLIKDEIILVESGPAHTQGLLLLKGKTN